jgi:hypothetical protein
MVVVVPTTVPVMMVMTVMQAHVRDVAQARVTFKSRRCRGAPACPSQRYGSG